MPEPPSSGGPISAMKCARRAHLFLDGVRNCARDEGKPLGAGLQERASNHLKLLWSRARVVSVREKSWLRIMAGMDHGDEQQ